VVFNWGLVLRITAHRVLRTPAELGAWLTAFRIISMQQVTDLPEPTGPLIPLTKDLSFIKDLATGPGGL